VDLSEIILSGLQELLMISGKKDREDALKMIIKEGKILVLKQGNRGCEVYSGNERVSVPSFKIKEVDPTGAGDAFDAGFLCALLEGKNLYECGLLANACGALNTTEFGPMEGVFKRSKVDEFIRENK